LTRIATLLGALMGCSEPPADKVGQSRDTGEPARSGSLSVLSYNVHGLPSLITGDDTPARMVQIAPLLHEWDLLGLQEDWDADNHAVLTGATDHQSKLWFDALVSAERYYGSGLSVLARHPVIERQDTHYTTCSGILDGASDCLASKGFQVARLEIGAGQVDFYNTHLEAGGGDEDNAARSVQVDQLIEALTGYSAGQAVIFTGDFNLRSSDPDDLKELQRLQDASGLLDACEAVACDEPDHIDRVFFRSSDSFALTPQTWSNQSPGFVDGDGVNLSDHPPISASMSWEVLD
jgi:endonuclease/exonuclease/phosphatase family metal-dependent hydrolase